MIPLAFATHVSGRPAMGGFDYATQPTQTVAVCPVCGIANPSRPARDRYGFAIGVSACECGLAYLNPVMTADAYRRFYAGAYRDLLCGHGFDTLTPAQRMTKQEGFGGWLGWWLRYQVGDRSMGRLLDVGGGTGAIMAGMRQALSIDTVTVLDPCLADLAEARAFGYHTIVADAEDQPALPAQDAVICVRALDHLRDPLPVLRWVRQLCTGWAYFDVVDRGAAWKIDHPLYWSKAALRRALTETGWAIAATLRYRSGLGSVGHLGVFCR